MLTYMRLSFAKSLAAIFSTRCWFSHTKFCLGVPGKAIRVNAFRLSETGEEGSRASDAGPGAKGLRWKRWSKQWLYEKLGLYKSYRLRRLWSPPKVQPAEIGHITLDWK